MRILKRGSSKLVIVFGLLCALLLLTGCTIETGHVDGVENDEKKERKKGYPKRQVLV